MEYEYWKPERRGSILCAILQNSQQLEMVLFPKKVKAGFFNTRGLLTGLTAVEAFSAELELVKCKRKRLFQLPNASFFS